MDFREIRLCQGLAGAEDVREIMRYLVLEGEEEFREIRLVEIRTKYRNKTRDVVYTSQRRGAFSLVETNMSTS